MKTSCVRPTTGGSVYPTNQIERVGKAGRNHVTLASSLFCFRDDATERPSVLQNDARNESFIIHSLPMIDWCRRSSISIFHFLSLPNDESDKATTIFSKTIWLGVRHTGNNWMISDHVSCTLQLLLLASSSIVLAIKGRRSFCREMNDSKLIWQYLPPIGRVYTILILDRFFLFLNYYFQKFQKKFNGCE